MDLTGIAARSLAQALLAPPVLQVPRSRFARRRALPHPDRRLARRRRELRRLRRRAVQPVLLAGCALRERGFACKTCQQGGGCPDGCIDVRRVVLLPDERPGRLPLPLLRVQLRPTGNCSDPACHCFTNLADPLHASAALGRPAVRVPAGQAADPEPRALDGPDVRRRPQARRAVVHGGSSSSSSESARSAPASSSRGRASRSARSRAASAAAAGRATRASASARSATNAGFPCKTCQQGAGCPEGCITSGEWFCCLTTGRVGCRFRCSECNCGPNHDCTDLSCHCFTDMAVPCTPRLHSGDQPCGCPADAPPIPALGA